MSTQSTVVKRKDFEQIVYGEVLVPGELNVYGDVMDEAFVRHACEQFTLQGYGLDVDHDEVNLDKKDMYVVESFIAREGDPDFTPGSWVVGVKIISDELWEKVLDGTLNGFSYQALVRNTPVILEVPDTTILTGITEPDLLDGHTHDYTVIVDQDGRVISGGTSETDGHSHQITTHSVTMQSDGHTHRVSLPDAQSLGEAS